MVYISPKREGRTAAWMNLGNIIWSERSQAQKATYSMIPFTELFKSTKSENITLTVSGLGRWGLGGRELVAKDSGVSFQTDGD